MDMAKINKKKGEAKVKPKRPQINSLKVQTNFIESADAMEEYRIEHQRTPLQKAVHLAKYPHLSKLGQTLTERNPKYDKMLTLQLESIEKARKMKSKDFFIKQRSFFIKSVFDAENGLRFQRNALIRSRANSKTSQVSNQVAKSSRQSISVSTNEKTIETGGDEEKPRMNRIYFRDPVKGKAKLDSTNIRSIEDAHQELRLHRASLSSILYNKAPEVSYYDQALRRKSKEKFLLTKASYNHALAPLDEHKTPTSSQLSNHKLSDPTVLDSNSSKQIHKDTDIIQNALKNRSKSTYKSRIKLRRYKKPTFRKNFQNWNAEPKYTEQNEEDIMWLQRTENDEVAAMEQLLQRMTISLPSNLISAAGGHKSTINNLNKALGYTDRNEKFLSNERYKLKSLQQQTPQRFKPLEAVLLPTKTDVFGKPTDDQIAFNETIDPLRKQYRGGKKFKTRGGEFILRNMTLAEVQAIRDRRNLVTERGNN